MKHLTSTKQPEQILVEIENYLRNVSHTVQHFVCGGYVYLTINYDDFKPRREVRDYIENIADNCIVEEINRGYSDKYIVEATQTIDMNDKLMIRLADGTIQEVGLWMLIEKYLQYRSFKRALVERHCNLDTTDDEKEIINESN